MGRVETANDFIPAKHMLVPPRIKHDIFSIAMLDDRRLFPFGFFC